MPKGDWPSKTVTHWKHDATIKNTMKLSYINKSPVFQGTPFHEF